MTMIMHDFVAVTLLVFLSGVAFSQFTCPEDPASPSSCLEGNYPNEFDCTKFWQCVPACIAYSMDCPAGLHFSPGENACQIPSQANCEESTTPSVTTTTTSATTTTTTTVSTTSQQTVTVPDTTTAGSTETPVLINPSVFFAARTSNLRGTKDPVAYEAEFDRKDDFNIADHTFTAPSDGLYFFSLCAGYQAGHQANFRMEHIIGPSTIVNVRRRSGEHNDIDMAGRDVIYDMAAGDQLKTTQFTTLGRLYSSTRGLETSWLGISIHNSMDRVSAFSVGRESSTSTTGVVDFPTVFVNTGDLAGNVYTAPEAGTYLFSLSAGADTGALVRVALTVNGATVAELYKNHGSNDNIVTLSRSLIYSLNAGDVVAYQLISGDLWSNNRYPISFSGFFVKPKYTPQVSWSVSKTTSWSSSSELNPVDYNEVTVNEGNAYNSATYSVVIPYSGFYYFSLGAGVQANQPLDVSIVYNGGVSLIHLTRLATNHNNVDTMSRAAVWYLSAGDVLSVKAEPNTAFYGDSTRRLTNFQGFLIYSNQ